MLKNLLVLSIIFTAFLFSQGYDETSIIISNPKAKQKGKYTNIQDIDFSNYTYELGGNKYFLEDSIYEYKDEIGGEEVGFTSVNYCFNKKYAIVSLYLLAVGGSSTFTTYLQLYTLKNHELILLSELSYINIATNIDCDKNEIIIKSKLWLEYDPHCCPSKLEIANIMIKDDTFYIKDIKWEKFKQ